MRSVASLERKFRELAISPRISTQQVVRYGLLGLVTTGRGIVPVLKSETVIGLPEVVYRPLAGEEVPFSMIYSPKNDNPALRTLLSLTRTMTRERAATAWKLSAWSLLPRAGPWRTRDPSR